MSCVIMWCCRHKASQDVGCVFVWSQIDWSDSLSRLTWGCVYSQYMTCSLLRVRVVTPWWGSCGWVQKCVSDPNALKTTNICSRLYVFVTLFHVASIHIQKKIKFPLFKHLINCLWAITFITNLCINGLEAAGLIIILFWNTTDTIDVFEQSMLRTLCLPPRNVGAPPSVLLTGIYICQTHNHHTWINTMFTVFTHRYQQCEPGGFTQLSGYSLNLVSGKTWMLVPSCFCTISNHNTSAA